MEVAAPRTEPLKPRHVERPGVSRTVAYLEWLEGRPEAALYDLCSSSLRGDREATGAADPPFARFPQWMWRNTDVAAFVDWLRDHNAGLSPEQRVGFHGLDLYSLYTSIAAILQYLDDVDPEAAQVARERNRAEGHRQQRQDQRLIHT